MFHWLDSLFSSKEFPARRWILYAFCFITVSTASGVVYGWPALRRQLQQDGSTLEESTLGAIFTVGAWTTQGGRFFVGLARDRFGTRSVTCVCTFFVATGFVGVAWSDPNNAISLGISVFFMGLGSGAQLCVQPVAGLFPDISGTIISSLSGAFQISGLVFLALTSGDSVGTRNVRFSGFAAILVILTCVAMVLLPRGKSFRSLVQDESSSQQDSKSNDGALPLNSNSNSQTIPENETNNDTSYQEIEGSQSAHLSNSQFEASDGHEQQIEIFDHNRPDSNHQDDEQVELEYATTQGDVSSTTSRSIPTAIQQMKSAEYILLCAWFSICLVPLQYYVGSIGFQLEEKGDEDGFYTDLFSILYAGAIVFSFAGGFLADKCGLGITQGLATVMCAGSFFFLVSDIALPGQSVGLALYGIGRLLIFGMYFANCGKRFGYANFGTLAGLGLLLSALASLVQYPMISAAANGHADTVNIGSGVILLAQIPYFVWLHQREKKSDGKL